MMNQCTVTRTVVQEKPRMRKRRRAGAMTPEQVVQRYSTQLEGDWMYAYEGAAVVHSKDRR